MKIKINSKLIAALNPCQDRHDNWLTHYKDFNENILDFLELENITAQDKIWVAIRVLPQDLVEVFAIDCAFSAYTYAAVDAAAACAACAAAWTSVDAATYASARATNAAFAAANAVYTAEFENQVDALIMIIKGG